MMLVEGEQTGPVSDGQHRGLLGGTELVQSPLHLFVQGARRLVKD